MTPKHECNEDGELQEIKEESDTSDMSIEVQIDLLAEIILEQILKEM